MAAISTAIAAGSLALGAASAIGARRSNKRMERTARKNAKRQEDRAREAAKLKGMSYQDPRLKMGAPGTDDEREREARRKGTASRSTSVGMGGVRPSASRIGGL